MMIMVGMMVLIFLVFAGVPIAIFRMLLFSGTCGCLKTNIAGAVRDLLAASAKNALKEILLDSNRIESWLRANNFVESTAEAVSFAVRASIDSRLPSLISGIVSRPAGAMVSCMLEQELDLYISGAMHVKLLEVSDDLPEKLAKKIHQIDNEEMKDFYKENCSGALKKISIYIMLYALSAGILVGFGLWYAIN